MAIPSHGSVVNRPWGLPLWGMIEHEPGQWFCCVNIGYAAHTFGPYDSRQYVNDLVISYQQQHQQFMVDHEKRKDLYWAMRSRRLTDVEMASVKAYGCRLVVFSDDYQLNVIQQEFDAALLQQHKIRLASEESELRRVLIRTGISTPETEILTAMKEYMS